MISSATLLTLLMTARAGLLPLSDDMMSVKADGAFTVLSATRQVRIANAAGLAKKWKRVGFCPKAHADGTTLVLDCDTGRLHAEHTPIGITLYKLRGMPWAASDDPVPLVIFPPELSGLGGPCPGTTPAGKAECLLAEGKLSEAKPLLTLALDTASRDYAALRLADLALVENRPLEAMEWIEKTGRSGQWGRLATVRLCDISGRCPKGAPRDLMYDSSGMDAPAARDLKLRELRVLRLESATDAITKLFDAGHGSWPDALCEGTATALCNLVLASALASDDPEARISGLTLFASGPVTLPGPRRPELASAAADAAVALGAPGFAAAALAAATPDVPKAKLASHLRKVIALYAASGQPGRASAVYSYALDTVASDIKKDPRWKKLRVRAPEPKGDTLAQASTPFATEDAELAHELAAAVLARSRLQEP